MRYSRAGREPTEVVSPADHRSLNETAYLLRSPANARRLGTAIERLERVGRDLAE